MNPISSTTNDIKLAYTGDQLNDLYDVLDTLHSAASENKLKSCTTMNENELLGLLRDLVYTAQETISEIEMRAGTQTTTASTILRLVQRVEVIEQKNA